ncbi:hypothetical protein OROGR_003686 [Orobanche gracilis]
MATKKKAAPPQGRAVVEEEQAEKELDTDDFSRLCSQHCGGIPTSYGTDERKSTMVCTTPADLDDGPDDASSVGKCRNINQQADHYKYGGCVAAEVGRQWRWAATREEDGSELHDLRLTEFEMNMFTPPPLR